MNTLLTLSTIATTSLERSYAMALILMVGIVSIIIGVPVLISMAIKKARRKKSSPPPLPTKRSGIKKLKDCVIVIFLIPCICAAAFTAFTGVSLYLAKNHGVGPFQLSLYGSIHNGFRLPSSTPQTAREEQLRGEVGIAGSDIISREAILRYALLVDDRASDEDRRLINRTVSRHHASPDIDTVIDLLTKLLHIYLKEEEILRIYDEEVKEYCSEHNVKDPR